MADFDFDAQLSRLYADPPPLDGNDAFTAKVVQRLDNGWALRRIGIIVAGAAAGVVGAWQLVSSRLLTDVQIFSQDSTRAVSSGYSHISSQAGELLSLNGGGGEVLWMAAALAALAVAFAVTRAADQF